MSGITWNRTTSRGQHPKYMEEDRAANEHSEGWPHYDRKGNCICFCKRCMGPAGCICKGCAGKGHANCDKGDYRLTQYSKDDKVRT